MLILLLLNLLGDEAVALHMLETLIKKGHAPEKDTQAIYVEDGYQDLLNGNLTDLSYMYLSNEDSDDENETESAPPQRHLDSEYEEYLFDANPEDCDLQEYNLLTKKVVNISRRGIPNRHLIENYGWYGGGWSWRDLSDAMYRPFWVNHEVVKKQKLIDLCIQFLIHIRYKVHEALKQREPIRNDKRYKLGYLFNRLRRLHTEHTLMASAAATQDEHNLYMNHKLLLRHYQHVVRIDVDIRDIQAQIREVYSREQPCDFVTKRSNTESTP